ncbi:ABC transporter permease subunit [Mameliella alba]|nr:ABC transporter permease subunit [Mameliella alba]MBY6171112.1 ABC transporter permease subunit [Mameliella alba]MBY6176336.1 ABC transporter permease subunit [Mameliella alba]
MTSKQLLYIFSGLCLLLMILPPLALLALDMGQVETGNHAADKGFGAAIGMPVAFGAGWAAAHVIDRRRRRHAAGAVVHAPMLMPGLVMAAALIAYYGLIAWGASDPALVTAQAVLVAAVPVAVIAARLRQRPVALEEMALGHGAPRWWVFCQVTLPFLLPVLAAAAGMVAAGWAVTTAAVGLTLVAGSEAAPALSARAEDFLTVVVIGASVFLLMTVALAVAQARRDRQERASPD